MPPAVRPLAERFWEKVNKRSPDECWLWAGALNKAGYGQIFPGGDRRTPNAQAHRVAYELSVGPIPEGLEIDHHCENAACVNPAHLEPVQTWVNQQRASKGRCAKGHEYRTRRITKDGRTRIGHYCLVCQNDARRARRG